MSTPKPYPVPDHLSEPFWQGCRDRQLLLQRCSVCDTPRFPAGPVCMKCGSDSSRWVAASGRAKVYSWIVVRHPIPADVYGDAVPYVVALVDLEEGVRMPTNIIGCDVDAVAGDMDVEVVYTDVTPTITLPRFKPAGAA